MGHHGQHSNPFSFPFVAASHLLVDEEEEELAMAAFRSREEDDNVAAFASWLGEDEDDVRSDLGLERRAMTPTNGLSGVFRSLRPIATSAHHAMIPMRPFEPVMQEQEETGGRVRRALAAGTVEETGGRVRRALGGTTEDPIELSSASEGGE